MPFAFVENSAITAYPIGSVEIKRRFPNTSFRLPLEGQDLSDFGVVEVTLTSQPSIDRRSQRLEETTPVLESGVWKQAWNVVTLSDEEQQQIQATAAQNTRAKRNQLLAETDWTQLSDSSVASTWTEYRQALRDVPSQEGFPYTVTWPTKPS